MRPMVQTLRTDDDLRTVMSSRAPGMRLMDIPVDGHVDPEKTDAISRRA